MADKPRWRRAFDSVDRRVSGPVERAAGSDAFHDALTLGLRLQAGGWSGSRGGRCIC
jgi:hypothetical protein